MVVQVVLLFLRNVSKHPDSIHKSKKVDFANTGTISSQEFSLGVTKDPFKTCDGVPQLAVTVPLRTAR